MELMQYRQSVSLKQTSKHQCTANDFKKPVKLVVVGEEGQGGLEIPVYVENFSWNCAQVIFVARNAEISVF